MKKQTIKNVNLDASDPNFWNDFENNNTDNILKWNETGEYGKEFSNEDKMLLDQIQNLPEVPDINVGDIVEGKINKIDDNEIIIDVNYKDTIYVDLKPSDLKIVQNLKQYDTTNVLITDIKDSPYEIKGSITELIKMNVATKLSDYLKDDIALEATVLELIPAGFMLSIEMDNIIVTAFMPKTLAGINKLTEHQSNELIGTKINVMFESLQQEKGVYVVSRKKYLRTLIPNAIKQLKKDVKLDETIVYSGKVTGSKHFGVFVEFGECLTGMIYKVNLNPAYQDKIHEIEPGTMIDFYVKDVLKDDKIILTQILRESLWDNIKLNQIKEGVVCSIKSFGALVALDDETTGLIQKTYIEKSNITLKTGDNVKVKVVTIFKDERKIYLDLVE